MPGITEERYVNMERTQISQVPGLNYFHPRELSFSFRWGIPRKPDKSCSFGINRIYAIAKAIL